MAFSLPKAKRTALMSISYKLKASQGDISLASSHIAWDSVRLLLTVSLPILIKSHSCKNQQGSSQAAILAHFSITD